MSIGVDPTPVSPPSSEPSVGESVTIQGDENDDVKLLGILYGLIERCSRRLRLRGVVPGRAGLTIRYSDQEEITRQTRVAGPCPTDLDLYADLERVFFKACLRRTGVRFMRVWFRDLSHPSPQLSLFLSALQDREKRDKVTRALDCIRERYGDGAIEYGRTV